MHIRTTSWLAASFTCLAVSACSSSAGTGATDSTATTSSDLQSTGREGVIVPRLSGTATATQSTAPRNGDTNPYGVTFVTKTFPKGGLLEPGDILVSNFNNSGGLQGTGTTIVRFHDNVGPTVFFEDASALGLSTALNVLQAGFVVVGNVPSTNSSGMCTGDFENVGRGALRFIDRNGHLVRTLESETFVDGPWDMTVDDHGSTATLYVSNVRRGTVSRIELAFNEKECDERGNPRIDVVSEKQIASGYLHRCDPTAFVVGPTGLALDRNRDVLYVSATGDNVIYAVDACSTRDDRGKGRPVVTDQTHLHGPLGLVLAENGDLISAQGDVLNIDPNHPSEIVEFTSRGQFVDQLSIDSAQGSAFGIALEERRYGAFKFAAVDDGTNEIHIWDVR